MKVRTARLAAVLAAALLISTAMVAAAVEPAPPEAPVTSECRTTAPGPAELGEAHELGEAQEPVEVPGLSGTAPEPVPTTDHCDTACLEAWAVCVDSCPGNPGEPANEACRRDCLRDKSLCLNECWSGGCHWLNPGC